MKIYDLAFTGEKVTSFTQFTIKATTIAKKAKYKAIRATSLMSGTPIREKSKGKICSKRYVEKKLGTREIASRIKVKGFLIRCFTLFRRKEINVATIAKGTQRL